MLDLLKPLARPNLFTFNELSHGVERSGGEMAPLRLVRKFVSGKLTDEVGEGLRDFRSVHVTVFRIFPFGTRKRLIGHPVLGELSPHVRHIGGEMDVMSVFAAVDVGTGTAIVFAAGPPLQPILSRVARNRTAVGEGQGFLKRNIDPLAESVQSGVTNTRKAQGRSHARRDLVGQMTGRRTLSLGVVALTIKKTAGSIGDGIAAFVVSMGSRASERSQRNSH